MANKKIKNVLSIDMDYIMAPSIGLYNDLAGNPEFQNCNFWEKVDMVRNVDKFVSFDENKLLFLTDIFAKQLGELDPENFFFANEHDGILEFLCGDEKKKDEVFNVYNIDHHHDVFYGPNQKADVDRFDFATLANWVYYLGKHEKLNKYYWVRNENSLPLEREACKMLDFPADLTNIWEKTEELFNVKFDYVFVCKSAEFFPSKFQYLFEQFRIMAGSSKGRIYDVFLQPYCIDGKSRLPIK